MRRVSLADVARAAGVAKATASRALSQHHRDVGEATRARIQSIAEDMGYQPSQVAQALRTGRFHTLGLLLPDDHPDWSALVRGASAEASRRGYDVVVRPLRADQPLRRQAVGLSVDGLVAVAAGSHEPNAGSHEASAGNDEASAGNDEDDLGNARNGAGPRSGPPTVLIDQDRAPSGAVVVRADEFDAGALACRHLVDLGRRNLALVVPALPSAAVRQRLAGARETLRQHQAAPVAELSVTPQPCGDTTSALQRVPALDTLLAASPALDGVVALGTGIGVRSLGSLRHAGRAVPDEVAVVAFEDATLAELVQPRLSSVGVDARAVGALAVAELVRGIEGHGGRAGVHAVAPAIQVRGSSSTTPVPQRLA